MFASPPVGRRGPGDDNSRQASTSSGYHACHWRQEGCAWSVHSRVRTTTQAQNTFISRSARRGPFHSKAALPLSQFPVFIAVILRVPLALRTLENVGVGRSPRAVMSVANSNSQPHRWHGGTLGISMVY